MPIQTTCKTCGRPFTVKPNQFGRVLNCSTRCAALSRRKNPDAICQRCGATFRPASRSAGAKFCSQRCRTEYLRSLAPDERAAMMAKATARIRGAKRSPEDLQKRARTKQERAQLSGDEAEIMAALNAAGLHPVPLYAFDKYNIDFAFPDRMVAVEYQGGNWHNTPQKREQDARKAAFLESEGWRLLVFPRLDKPQPNNAGNRRIAIDEIVRQTIEALHR